MYTVCELEEATMPWMRRREQTMSLPERLNWSVPAPSCAEIFQERREARVRDLSPFEHVRLRWQSR